MDATTVTITTVCGPCQSGKQSREKAPQSTNQKAVCILDLIHSDVCGPLTPALLSGTLYFFTITDDFSRKYWVYFIRYRSKVFACFRHFYALIFSTMATKVKGFRSNCGGQYMSDEFRI